MNGVLAMPPSEVKSVIPVLIDPANRHRAVPLTPEQFHYAFHEHPRRSGLAGGLRPLRGTDPARILFDGGLANFTPHAATTFDFSHDSRAPLLWFEAAQAVRAGPKRRRGPGG